MRKLTSLTTRIPTYPTLPIPTPNTKSKNNNHRKLTLTITQIIVYEIWQSRNNMKYDSITLPPKTTILKAHFQKYKIENTLTTFEELFCINKAIEQLQDGQLPMLIPPP